MAVIDEIEHLSRRRQTIWFEGPGDGGGGGEVLRLTGRLADLYEQKRHEVAQMTAVKRTEVVRRARVESELERLVVR